jgi:hypothetical protein
MCTSPFTATPLRPAGFDSAGVAAQGDAVRAVVFTFAAL